MGLVSGKDTRKLFFSAWRVLAPRNRSFIGQ